MHELRFGDDCDLALVLLRHQVRHALHIERQHAQSLHLVDQVFDFIAQQRLHRVDELVFQFGLKDSAAIPWNERHHVGVHLWHYERVNVEQFRHPLHRQVCRNRPVNVSGKRWIRMIWLYLPVFIFDQQFHRVEKHGDRGTGSGCRPNKHIRRGQVVQETGFIDFVWIRHGYVQIPLELVVDLLEGKVANQPSSWLLQVLNVEYGFTFQHAQETAQNRAMLQFQKGFVHVELHVKKLD